MKTTGPHLAIACLGLLGVCSVAACIPSGTKYSFDNTTVSGLALDPAVPGQIVALHAGRVERSTDGGATWTVSSNFARLSALGGSGSTIYGLEVSGTSTETRVFCSKDAGATFAAASPLPAIPAVSGPGALGVAATDSRLVAVALSGAPPVIELSHDGGATWQVASITSLSRSTTIEGVAFDASSSQVVYVAHSSGLLQSLDGGVSFVPLATPFAQSSVGGVAASGSSVFVATATGLGVSSDGGATWSLTKVGRNSIITAVAIDPLNPARLYLALNGEGIYGSTDGGRTFTLLIAKYSGPIVAGGGTIDVGGARSVDSGVTWQAYGVFDYSAPITIFQ